MPRGAVAAIVSILLWGCAGGGDPVPTTLINGHRAPNLSVELQDIDDRVVLTSVATSRSEEVEAGSIAAKCLARAVDDPASRPVVVRIGVDGETVTVRAKGGLYGCDNSDGEREGNRAMCGVAFGQLYEGRLRDPRLDVGGCTTKDGADLGFAWVEPGPRTRYVAVEQGAFVEVYETAGRLPVRVATREVETDTSSATFRVSEHSRAGDLIRRYRLEARVAG